MNILCKESLIYQVVYVDKKLILLGYSGHAYVAADIALLMGYQMGGYLDQQESLNNPFQIQYLGSEKNIDLSKFSKDHVFFPAVGDNQIRQKLFQVMELNVCLQTKLIHPKAVVSAMACVADSTLVAASAVINPLAVIGRGCIINTGAVIEHECQIEDFVHIAPGAVLAGHVSVGHGTFVGAGALVKQGIKIGRNVVVGAGAVVLADIPDSETWVGMPASFVKKN